MTRSPTRTAMRIVAARLRARRDGRNVTAILLSRIVTRREPRPTVLPRIFERQLTRTRPLRAIVPLTRNRRPVTTAATFVRIVDDPVPGDGTLTVATAALCGPPRPCTSISHNRTLYVPGPGAVTRAAPEASTLFAPWQVAWHNCTIARAAGAGGLAGSRHVSATTLDPSPSAVAISAEGGGGPLLSTRTGGDVATWLFPAASVTT